MNQNVKQAQSIVGTSPGRPKTDFYPTPAYVTEALLEKEKFPHFIWECACGDGSMSKVLIERGYKVYSSDLYNHGYGEIGIDFAGLTEFVFSFPKEVFSNSAEPFGIITNPPFSLSLEFVQSALKVGATKFAFLCKLAFLEGQKRAAFLEQTPLETVYVFKKRIQLTRNGKRYENGGMIAFAWFVWNLRYAGLPMVKWI